MKTADYLKEHGVILKKSLGQNFLSDERIAKRIVENLEIKKEDTILEIGAGAGTLTEELLKTGAFVYTVEIDERLRNLLEDRLKSYPNKKIVFQDFLKSDISFLPEHYRCVSNIPYYITGPIIVKLLHTKFYDLSLMIQKEVAERLLEPPGSSNRGFLTVVVQTFCDVKRLLNVSKSSFLPNPDVDSIVLRLVRREFPVNFDYDLYFEFISKSFSNKRKTLANNFKTFISKEVIEKILSKIDGRKRPEQLTTDEWLTAFEIYSKYM